MRTYKKLLSLSLAGILCLPFGIFADETKIFSENTLAVAEKMVDAEQNLEGKETVFFEAAKANAEEDFSAEKGEAEEKSSNIESLEREENDTSEGVSSTQEIDLANVAEKDAIADENVSELETLLESKEVVGRTQLRGMAAATMKQFTQTATIFENNGKHLEVATTVEDWTKVKGLTVKLDGETIAPQKYGSYPLLGKGEYFFGSRSNNNIAIAKQNFTEYKTYTVEISAAGYETATFTFEYVEELPPTNTMSLRINRPVITQNKILEINYDTKGGKSDDEINKFFDYSYSKRSELKITIDGEEIKSSNIQSKSTYKAEEKAFRITPDKEWSLGEHTVIVEKKDYPSVELSFTVDKIKQVDVVSTPTVSPKDEKDFPLVWQLGKNIDYTLLAVDITFENGKVARALSYKYLKADWGVKMSPEEGYSSGKLINIGKQNVILTIDGFEKEIPIEVIGKKFELQTPWVQLKSDPAEAAKESIKIGVKDEAYQMSFGNLKVKAGNSLSDMKELKFRFAGRDNDITIKNKTIEIPNFATQEGIVYIEISHDEYASELFEIMVAAEEPTEFLALQAQKKALVQKIKDAEALDTAGKTDESVAALTNVIKAAQDLLDNKDATTKQVDDALQAIQNAIEELKDKPATDPNGNSGSDNTGGNDNSGTGTNNDGGSNAGNSSSENNNQNSGANNSSNTNNTSGSSVSTNSGGSSYSSVRPDPISPKSTVIEDNATPKAEPAQTAAPEQKEIRAKLVIGDKNYKKYEANALVDAMLDVAPILQEGRTMLPARAIAELFGIEVGYDAASKTATFVYITQEKKNIVELTLGKNTMKVNGEEVALSTQLTQVDGRIVLPLRDIQRALKDLGLETEIQWNAETKEITIR